MYMGKLRDISMLKIIINKWTISIKGRWELALKLVGEHGCG
jgi:hypothetical protein